MRQSFSNHLVKDTLSVRRFGLTRKLMCDSSLPTDLVEALWDDPDQRLIPRSTVLQEKERCAVLRVDYPQQNGPQQSFLLKRHIWGPASRSARMLLRQPTATRSAVVSALLSENEIPTPTVRGCVVDGLGPLSHRSYLLTDFIAGTTLFHAIRAGNIPNENLPGVAQQVTAIWQRLIELNISHNDLKPENFMVDKSLRVWLVDFEKTKLHRDQTKLRRRHLDDVERFLHVRSWRNNTDAAEVFRQELLRTSLQTWVTESQTAEHRLLRKNYTEAELCSRISVVVPASKKEIDRQALISTIDSVRDVADEILLVEPDAITVQLQVWHTLATPGYGCNLPLDLDNRPTVSETKKPLYPWVLVMCPGERATPDLVRQLPEWVIEAGDTDAFNLPIITHSLERTLRWRQPLAQMSQRVFRQGYCKFALVQGEPKVAALENRATTKHIGIIAPAGGESASSLEIAADHSVSRRTTRSKTISSDAA